MANTTRETVRLLCKTILSRLENQKAVEFAPRLRQVILDELFDRYGRYILTEEDLRKRTLDKIGANADALQDSQLTESAQYKAAKSIVRKGFGDDELNGLYFQKTLKDFATGLREYLLTSSHIDEVYETDEDLERQIVEWVKKFNPANIH